MAGWNGFFAAQVSATAALAGLLFVAISVNVTRILQFPWLPRRAGQTLVVLMGALIESSLALMPMRSERVSWLLILAMSLFTYVSTAWLSDLYQKVPAQWRVRPEYARLLLINVAASQCATLPAVVGSILALTGAPNAYYWLAAGIIAALGFGVYNAWVLLIEILR